MPTFTTIALESLIEPRLRDSYKINTKSGHVKKKEDVDDKEVEDQKLKHQKKKAPSRNRVNISPALYITPEPTPIIHSSSDSLSPSPYVVNRKGRGGKSLKSRIDGFEVRDKEGRNGEGEMERGCEGKSELQFEETVGDNCVVEVEEGVGEFVEEDDFLDTRCDSLSVGSSSEVIDLGIRGGSLSVTSNQAEFYDADDDFSSDGSISNTLHSSQTVESELRSTRLTLLEEIEKRKMAEDAVDLMCNQWRRLGNLLSAQAGLRFPSPPTDVSMRFEIDPIEQFCQEVVVTQYVSEAIAKGLARAEAEFGAEEIFKTKDQEISRLKDRLQYYEAVNHEMSQRNQEVIEVARRQRQKKKSQQKWIWSGIGLSIAIGASVFAYSCLHQTTKIELPLTTSDSSDASCIISSAESTLES